MPAVWFRLPAQPPPPRRPGVSAAHPAAPPLPRPMGGVYTATRRLGTTAAGLLKTGLDADFQAGVEGKRSPRGLAGFSVSRWLDALTLSRLISICVPWHIAFHIVGAQNCPLMTCIEPFAIFVFAIRI